MRIAAICLAGFLAAGCGYVSLQYKSPEKGNIQETAEWNMDGCGPERLSRCTFEPDVDLANGERVLTSQTPELGGKSGETASPLVLGDYIISGNATKAVWATRWSDGKVLWSHQLRGRMLSSPAYGEGRIFVADEFGWVEALDLEGRKIWEFRVPKTVAAPLILKGRTLYVVSIDQVLTSLDAATGKPNWRYQSRLDREGTIWRGSSPAVNDSLVYLGLSEGEVVALDAEYGRVVWKKTITPKTMLPDVSCGPVFENGVVYAGAMDGPFAAMKGQTGEIIWKKPYRSSGSIAVGQEALYFGTVEGNLVALKKSDGSEIWSVKLEGGVPGPPVIAGDKIYVGMTMGAFYKLNSANGKVLQSTSPGTGIQARPWVGQRGVLFVSNSGVLHLFDRRR